MKERSSGRMPFDKAEVVNALTVVRKLVKPTHQVNLIRITFIEITDRKFVLLRSLYASDGRRKVVAGYVIRK